MCVSIFIVSIFGRNPVYAHIQGFYLCLKTMLRKEIENLIWKQSYTWNSKRYNYDQFKKRKEVADEKIKKMVSDLDWFFTWLAHRVLSWVK